MQHAYDFSNSSFRSYAVVICVPFDLFKDFDILGEKMVSCGMDHSLKIWSLETDAVKKVNQTENFAGLQILTI